MYNVRFFIFVLILVSGFPHGGLYAACALPEEVKIIDDLNFIRNEFSITHIAKKSELLQKKSLLPVKEMALGQIPSSISIKNDVYYQDVLNDRGDIKQNDTTISASLDLMELIQGNVESIAQIDLLLAKTEVLSAQAIERKETYKSIVEIKAVNDQIKSFQKRKLILDRKIEYLRIRQEMGEQVSSDLLDSQAQLIELTSKIDAAVIKRSRETTKLEVSIIFNPELLGGLSELAKNLSITCNPEDNFNVTLAHYQVEIAKRKRDKFLDSNGLGVDFYANRVAENDLGSSEVLNKFTAGLELSYPIWQGGAYKAEKATMDNDVQLASILKSDALRFAKDELIDWVNVKKVLEATLITNEMKYQGQLEEYKKLTERVSLGDSVFLELSDLAIQVSLVEEAMIGIRKDLLLKFLDVLAQYPMKVTE